MTKEKSFLSNKWLVWFSMIIAYLGISIYNGYPILYSDTATYISSGFELEAPADRPIVYGLLIRLFSLNGLSLFLVPVFQSVLFLFALKSLLEQIFEKDVVLKYLLILSILVLLLTGFGWSINLLLPDIFTSIGFIYLFCIINSNRKPRQQILLFILFFVSTSSHISNVFVFFVVTLFVFLTRRWFLPAEDMKIFKQKLGIIFCLLVISYLLMGSAISKSRHVFMMGSMAQKGILQKVLSDKCATNDFKLCIYKDSIPNSFEYFVWNKKSPLYAMGGWKATKEEYRKIVALSFSESTYIKQHIKQSSINFVSQLGTFGIGEGNGSFGEDTPLIQRIKNYTLLDAMACTNTKQFNSSFINLDMVNYYYKVIMALAVLVFISLLAFQYKNLTPAIKFLIILSIVLILSNSALVAFTSEVSNRFGC